MAGTHRSRNTGDADSQFDACSNGDGKPGSVELQLDASASTTRAESHVHRGWYHSNALPHFDRAGLLQHITYRLADSLPKQALDKLDRELEAFHDDDRRSIERRRRIEGLLDAGHGACLLRHHDCARLVERSWLHFDGERYDLIAWVVMPNHCHVLIRQHASYRLADIMQSWRAYTGRR